MILLYQNKNLIIYENCKNDFYHTCIDDPEEVIALMTHDKRNVYLSHVTD